jgi:CubicO group peptidase (beta-lactamase class C family)
MAMCSVLRRGARRATLCWIADYTTHAFYHAALVLEDVTGEQYNQFTTNRLLKPLGIEKWMFVIKTGSIGGHASHDMGLPARAMARIAYSMLKGGKWNTTQVIPSWFVTETAKPTQSINPEYTHGWELPGKVDSRIPGDARSKRGSGGQYIAFVPSKSLVILRHTGGSGSWGTAGFPKKYYYDYLAKAVSAVLP